MKAVPKKRSSKKKAPARRRVRANGLSERDILDAALELIRVRSVEALSMRVLAQKLGVSAMAIYYYVPHKDALLERVADLLSDHVPMPEPSGTEWEAQLGQYAQATWDTWSKYPGLYRITVERPPAKAFGANTLYVIALMRAAGFEGREAVLGAVSFLTHLSGLLSGHARMLAFTQAKPRKKKKAKRVAADLSEARQAFELVRHLSPREWMEFSVETAISGLRSQRDVLSAGRKHNGGSRKERVGSADESRARS